MLDLFPPTVGLTDLRSGRTLDGDGLRAEVFARSALFSDSGLGRGKRLALAEPDPLAFLTDLLATWQIGATVVCLPPSLTQSERDNVAELTGAALWSGGETGGTVPCIPPGSARIPFPTLPPADIGLDEPALILMTSGTTGTPKGVVHTHRSLRARLALNIAEIDAANLSRSLSLLPMHFGHGLIGNCLTPLAAGGTLFVMPDPGVDGLGRLGEIIDRNRIGFMSSVPAMWRIALRLSSPPKGGSLERVHVGSAPLPAALWRDIITWTGTRHVVNCYGITETANWIGGADADAHEPEDGLVGRPWGGAIRLLQEDGELSESGTGEVAVATPSLMAGYFERPDLTVSAFRGGWFLTGDRGEIDADGLLRIAGRRKNEINRAGIKVPAEEIDLLLERHPAISEACAFGLADPVAGELVGAAIVLEDDADVTPADILAWCELRIRREAVPSRLFVVGEIPKTDRGKINRDRVRDAVLKIGEPAA